MSHPSADIELIAFCAGVDLFQEFNLHISYPMFFRRVQYYLNLHQVECFLVVNESDAEWYIIISVFLVQLVYDVDVVCR